MTERKDAGSTLLLPRRSKPSANDRRLSRGAALYLLALAGELQSILKGLGLRPSERSCAGVSSCSSKSRAASAFDARIEKVDLSELLIAPGSIAGSRPLPVDQTSSGQPTHL